MVKLALDKAVADDACAEQSKQEVDKTVVAVGDHAVALLYNVHLVSRSVQPVKTVNAAGDEREQEHNAAGGILSAAGCRVEVVHDADLPVNAVDAEGDDRKDYAQCNVALFDRRTVGPGRSLLIALLVGLIAVLLLVSLLLVGILLSVCRSRILCDRCAAARTELGAVADLISAMWTEHDYFSFSLNYCRWL